MSLVTGIQPAEFIFVSSLQARHQKNDYMIRKTNGTNMTRKHLQRFWTAGQNKLLKQKQAAKENAVPKLHQKVSGDVSRHWNSARWIYLCLILANSSQRTINQWTRGQTWHESTGKTARLSNRSDKQAAKENAVPKLHQKVSGDVSRHWNSARWIYLCLILANSSHKNSQPMNKRTNMTWKHLQDVQTAVTNKLQKKTLFQNCIRK